MIRPDDGSIPLSIARAHVKQYGALTSTSLDNKKIKDDFPTEYAEFYRYIVKSVFFAILTTLEEFGELPWDIQSTVVLSTSARDILDAPDKGTTFRFFEALWRGGASAKVQLASFDFPAQAGGVKEYLLVNNGVHVVEMLAMNDDKSVQVFCSQ